MNLIKRIKTLWRLSEYKDEELLKAYPPLSRKAYEPSVKMATIIKMHDTETIIKEILEDK